MNQPRVYMCPLIPNLPPTSLPIPSRGFSQCTSFKCPVSRIELRLVIYFTDGNIHVSMLFSQIMSVSLLLSRIQGFHLPAVRETWVQSPGWEDPLEKETASHSSTLAWKIPWMEEPGRLQSMGSKRVAHNCATSIHMC